MTHIIDTNSKRRLSARLAAGLAISALLLLGGFAGSAGAEERDRDGDRGGHNWRDHDGDRGGYNWNGGYYRSPPVVYGSPYGGGYYGSQYYAPPVVYGPGIGIIIR
jgi:hypothetical protein